MSEKDGRAALAMDGYVHPGPRFTQSGLNAGHGMGLSLRDWFAGQIMAAIAPGSSRTWAQDAESAYLGADAMLAARTEGGEDNG